MTFKHTDYITQFLANPGYNDAGKYGVSIVPDKVTPTPGQNYWRVAGIHHLTGPENHGQHNVFCDVIDEQGKRLYGTKLVVLNANNTINHVVIDKGENEPGTNAPMHWDDTLEFYVATGGLPGDHAKGFHIRHEDEEAGTSRGHHSFYVVWQRVKVGATQPPDPDPIPPSEDSYVVGSRITYTVSHEGELYAEAPSLDKARRIADALTALDASDADHPISRCREELERWNRGEA